MSRFFALLLVALTVFAASHVQAQSTRMDIPSAERVDPSDALAQLLAAGAVEGGDDAAETAPAPDGPTRATANGLAFDATSEMRAELGRTLYREYKRTLDHNHDLFRWQLLSTKISFAVTIVLVLAGVTFSALQFWKSFKAIDEMAVTEMEISSVGMKVSSPVLGVIILLISLGFFYLFLVHVYPIEEVRDSGRTVASAQGG